MRPRRKEIDMQRFFIGTTATVVLLFLLSSTVYGQDVTPQPPSANVSSSFIVLSDAPNTVTSTPTNANSEPSQPPTTLNEVSGQTSSDSMAAPANANAFNDVPVNTGALALISTAGGSPDIEPINESGKRRQYLPPGRAAFDPGFLNAPALPAGPGLPPPPLPPGQRPAGPVGTCPSGGPSLPIECDPKRPWPQCPPQSYCYATNTVDIGPYFCCPIWSTYGAAWRPATPFYSYAPPPPPNWPEVFRYAADPRPFVPRKSRKEPRGDIAAALDSVSLSDAPTEDQLRVQESVNGWLQRQPLIEAEDGQPTGGNLN